MIATCVPLYSRALPVLFLCWITFGQVSCKSTDIGKVYPEPKLSKLVRMEVEMPPPSTPPTLAPQPPSVEVTELQPESEEASEFELEFPVDTSYKEEVESTTAPKNDSITTEERLKKALEQAEREAMKAKKDLFEARRREFEASSARASLWRYNEGPPEEVEKAQKALADAQRATQEAQTKRKAALQKLDIARNLLATLLGEKTKEKLLEARDNCHHPAPKQEEPLKEKDVKKKKGRNKADKKAKIKKEELPSGS